MKKYFFIIACLITSLAIAENEIIYVPEEGILEIPILVIEGQEEGYSVEMLQTSVKDYNFEVTVAEPLADEIKDLDEELRATYDPETGVVFFPLVVVYAEAGPLDTYTVKMLKDEGDGLFFTVTQANPVDVKSSTNLDKPITSKRMQKNKIVKCISPYNLGGKVKNTYYFPRSCPKGWAETG